jgi:release factor glutamine methyltransferase
MMRTAIDSATGTVGELLMDGVARLRVAGCTASPELDVELLLAEALHIPRAQLRAHPEQRPEAAAASRFAALVERRIRGEPVAYLLGRKGFWTFELDVGPAVLVPRPETELLVERALSLRPEAHGRVADLGTGSAAIALALAIERPGWQVVATDLSAEALALARANAEALGCARVAFVQGSWCAALPAGAFDLLVSNPPYVAADDPALEALRCEPRLALTPGADAMACLRAIIGAAPAHLAPGGWLVLEHGAEQGRAVAGELADRGFVTVRTHRDLAGHERTTEGQWPTIR